MLKRTLIVIAFALGIGCKGKEMEQKPLYEHNERLPVEIYNADSSFRISIDKHWCIYDTCPHFLDGYPFRRRSNSSKIVEDAKWENVSGSGTIRPLSDTNRIYYIDTNSGNFYEQSGKEFKR